VAKIEQLFHVPPSRRKRFHRLRVLVMNEPADVRIVDQSLRHQERAQPPIA
jgi:hypothetical protein